MIKPAFHKVRTAILVTSLFGSTMALAEEHLTELTVTEAAAAIRNGEITSRALVEEFLARAEAEAGSNAMILLLHDAALAAADAVDAAIMAGEDTGPLAGVPLVIKDNIAVAGVPNTAGTPGLATFVPTENAPVIEALLDAGAIVLGKSNMHELAFGAVSDNAWTGAVANGIQPDLIPGGSSGGTGAAVALHMAPAGLGTDTGGSVRVPSALNGLAGLRPTTGRWSAEGIVPISQTRDTPGPMAQTVADLVLLDAVVAGETEALQPVTIEGLRFGIAHPLSDDLSPAVDTAFATMQERLEEAGAEFVGVDLEEIIELQQLTAFQIALFEGRQDIEAYLANYKTGVSIEALAEQIASPDVKATFMESILGESAPSEEDYRLAIDIYRPRMQQAYAELFAKNDIDALVFPTTPIEPVQREGNSVTLTLNGQERSTFLTYIRNTDPGSIVGIPGLTIPFGETEDELPVGLGLDGPAGSDRTLLAIGLAIEALD